MWHHCTGFIELVYRGTDCGPLRRERLSVTTRIATSDEKWHYCVASHEEQFPPCRTQHPLGATPHRVKDNSSSLTTHIHRTDLQREESNEQT